MVKLQVVEQLHLTVTTACDAHQICLLFLLLISIACYV